MTELKPCPFCGGEVFAAKMPRPNGGSMVYVSCDDDDCPASDVLCTPEEWNARATESSGEAVTNTPPNKEKPDWTWDTAVSDSPKLWTGQTVKEKGRQ